METQDKKRLHHVAAQLAAGEIKVIDLTHTLSERFPALQLPAEYGQVQSFKIEKISRYDEAGPAWYWNNFTCGEHTGTHFDAPAHWITGRDYPDNSVDLIPPSNFIAPAVVIDACEQVAKNEDWILTVDFLESWEAQYGRIPKGAWVLLRTDWSKRLPDAKAYLNMREDGAHTPGPSQEAIEWLIQAREVHGFGVETINTDAGQSYLWPVPYPCHTLMHGANKYGLQCLNNLDLLPPVGALIISAPLKIEAGSGSPLRVLALVE
ncbi:cyclase family protein [Pseudomonas sp. Marseille-QA0332]